VTLPRSLSPLRHRRFAALWSGAFASNIGTWMETIAVGILVADLTKQAFWPGLVAAAAFVPNGLVGPFGGALADRLPRRTLLIGATIVQAALAGLLTLLAAGDVIHPWSVTLIVFASGCANAIALPAYQSLMPELVPREDLPGAVALGAVQYNLGRVVGPLLAGLVIHLGSYELAFAINTVSFLAVIVAVAPLILPPPTPVHGESMRTSIGRGLQFARNEPGIRAAMTYLAFNSLLAAPFIALIPAVALKLFHNRVGGTSALVTAQGVGAVVLALALAGLAERWTRRRVVLTLMTALPASLLLYAAAPTLEFGVVALFLVGGCYLGCMSSFMTIAQLRAPSEFRGRVMSTFMLILGMLYPLGAVVQGALADEFGLRATTAGTAVLLVLTFGAVRMLRPSFDAELDDPANVTGEEPAVATIG
jgi:MFS family permease